MIEKLNVLDNTRQVVDRDGFTIAMPDNSVIRKINELVDAVNELQEAFESIHPYLKYKDLNKIQDDPADPYAEQRKWIGKLCRCWDSDINDDIWGILQDIRDNKTEKYYLYGIGYEHCEPVKPDDDIIYKGGDNE